MQENPFAGLTFAELSAAPAAAQPWPRYFARMLDVSLLGFVGSVFVSLVLVFATEDGIERFRDQGSENNFSFSAG